MGGTNLKGKVAIVTGASKGIGRSIALSLANEGINTALIARSYDKLIQLEKEINEIGSKTYVCEADLSKISTPLKVVKETIDFYGRLDILINNAGVIKSATLKDTTVNDWDMHMNLNARAPFLLSKEAIPYLKESEMPTIINISSVVGTKGYVNQGAYTASKHALMGWTKVLAQEVFDDDIRVHVISPGGVSTEMMAEAKPELSSSMLMAPKEVANIIMFLLKNRGNAVIDDVKVRRFSSKPWQ
ncbi:MAG: SDR family NAD(P)-dependent oxidoreductase [Eubacteriales bacterium]